MPNADPNRPNQMPQNDPNSAQECERRMVTQYNIEKVGSLETAKHII